MDYLRVYSHFVSQRFCANVKYDNIGQVSLYMKDLNLQYGFLSNYRRTLFLR